MVTVSVPFWLIAGLAAFSYGAVGFLVSEFASFISGKPPSNWRTLCAFAWPFVLLLYLIVHLVVLLVVLPWTVIFRSLHDDRVFHDQRELERLVDRAVSEKILDIAGRKRERS